MAEKELHSDEVTTEDEQHATAVNSGFFCDPCLHDGENTKADGFCVDCNEYLCSVCYNSHRKLKATRGHVLNDKTSMPVSKPLQINELEICAEHKFEFITHYCKSHDKALCKLCEQIDHRNCSEIQGIDDISCGSEDLKKLKDQLESLQNEFKENAENAKDNKSIAEKYHQDVIKRTRRLRDKDLQMMSAIENTCETVGSQITSLINDIDTCSTSSERLAVLLALKTKAQTNMLNARLTSVKTDNTISRYRFVETKTSDELSSDVLGVIQKGPYTFQDINLIITGMFMLNRTITGMIRLSYSRLVVLDYKNNQIILVDMTSCTVVLDMKLDITPNELSRIDGKRVAVTSKSDESILIVSVSDTFTVQKKIQTSNVCGGMVYFNNSLVVSDTNTGHIIILDMNGSVKQEINIEDKDGKVLFTGDISLAINTNSSILYISECGKNRVLSMTLDGKFIACFTHEHMKNPRGLTVNRDGRVFVCSARTDTIFEISSDLYTGHVLLNEKDGISNPRCIIYNDEADTICVGSSQKNTIQIFQL